MSYNLLKGRGGVIFGTSNDQSIAWKVIERAVEEGVAITLSNTPMTIRMGKVDALVEKSGCQAIPADVISIGDLESVFKTSMDIPGGQIDPTPRPIGMSLSVRKKHIYGDLDYGMLDKTLDISAVSFYKMIQSTKKLNTIADYGSIVALSYVTTQRTLHDYNDMADAEVSSESIACSFGYTYRRRHSVRVDITSQPSTFTTADSGVKGMDKLLNFSNCMSPLGSATVDKCADYCTVMFSDLTRKMTMQNLLHDGGLPSIGMSLRAMAAYKKGLDEYMDENGNIIYG